MNYQNVQTGRVVWRPGLDEWLEASAGWARVEPVTEPADAGADEADEADDEGDS